MRVSLTQNIQLYRDWMSRMSGTYISFAVAESMITRASKSSHGSCGMGRPNEIQGLGLITWEKKINSEELVLENYRPIRLGTHSRLTMPRKWCVEVDISFPDEAVIAGRGMSFEFCSRENSDHILKLETSPLSPVSEPPESAR